MEIDEMYRAEVAKQVSLVDREYRGKPEQDTARSGHVIPSKI